jgi:citronellol/citronellal dehydrogenase
MAAAPSIATAAIRYELGGEEVMAGTRTPEIVADAAYAILTSPARDWTDRFFYDDEILLAAGVRDFAKYDTSQGAPLVTDCFTEALRGMKVLWS